MYIYQSHKLTTVSWCFHFFSNSYVARQQAAEVANQEMIFTKVARGKGKSVSRPPPLVPNVEN